MQEIRLRSNTSGLRIFVNGAPEIKNIESAQLDVIVKALEKQIDDYFKSKRKDNPQKDSDDSP